MLLYLPLASDLHDHGDRKLKVKAAGDVRIRDGAAFFDGSKDWLELPHLPLNERPFAFSLWLKITGNAPVLGVIQQKDLNRRDRHFHLMLRRDLQPHFGFYLNDAISPTSIARNEWLHLLVQYDGAYQQIWVNSRLLVQRKARPFLGTSGATFVGRTPRWTNVPSQDFEGYMREVRLYGRALALQDIFALFRAGPEAAPQDSGRQSATPELSWALPFLAIEGHKLTINGQVGQVYELQATTNLGKPWLPLAVFTNRSGKLEYTDTDALKFNERFYRILVH